MGKLITIVGSAGVGKTTLARQLSRQAGFTPGLEQHLDRPFQQKFYHHRRQFAFANQVDYLLYRAEQELALRRSPGVGVLDGGLDEDFYVFTRLFHHKGYLTVDEYALCARVYAFSRAVLLPPDLIIRLVAPIEVIRKRFARRSRGLEIAGPDDVDRMEALLGAWLDRLETGRVLVVDASPTEPDFSAALPALLAQIRSILGE